MMTGLRLRQRRNGQRKKNIGRSNGWEEEERRELRRLEDETHIEMLCQEERKKTDFNKAESERLLERTEATAAAISIDDWAEKIGAYSQMAKAVAKLKHSDAKYDLDYY